MMLAPAQVRRSTGWRVVLAAAVAVPLATVGVAATAAWYAAWMQAEQAVSRAADTVAEYALRVLEAHRVAADRVDDLLGTKTDAEIRDDEAALHAELKALVQRLPLVRTAVVLTGAGDVLLAGNVFPVPRLSVADREWVVALGDPATPEPFVSRVHVGRLDGSLFFSMSIRRSGPAGVVPPGVVNLSIGPDDISAGFAALLGQDEDIVALYRVDGQMLARRPGFTSPPPALSPTTSFMRLASAQTERAVYRAPAAIGGKASLFAIRQVRGYPVYASVGRREATIVAAWRRTVLLQMAWAAPAMLTLIGVALFARRRAQAADLAQAALRREATRRAAAEAREAAEARFRGVFESDALGMAIFDLGTGATLVANGRLAAMVGAAVPALADWRDATPPDQQSRDAEAVAEARRAGWWRPFEKEFLRPDGSRLPVRVFSAALPREPGRVVVLVQDIAEQREAEERRDLLTQEVNHRAKNALATARAAIRLTRAADVPTYARVLDGRIGALAQAMSVLAATGWRGAELAELVESEIALFLGPSHGEVGPRADVVGEVLVIAPAAVQPLCMALHELATNAVKYGALSTTGGVLTIGWTLTGETLELVWRERGGPPIAAVPEPDGFGSRVLRATLERQLGGTVGLVWDAEGLTVTIRLPAARVLAAVPAAAA